MGPIKPNPVILQENRPERIVNPPGKETSRTPYYAGTDEAARVPLAIKEPKYFKILPHRRSSPNMETGVLPRLEDILRDSLAHASSHSKSVYGRNPLTAEELLDFANAKGSTSLAATVKPNGQPHLSPTDLIALDGRFFLGVDKATARYKNLQKNPRVTVMIMEGSKRQAIIEGQARFLETDSPLGKRVSELVKKKYGWTTDHLAELIPEKVLTYKSSSG